MTDVEARAPPFGIEIRAVLREVRVAGAREKPRRIVHRFAERVGHQHRAAECVALLEARLKAVEFRPRARFEERDIRIAGIGAQVQRRRARTRLVDVLGGDQIAPARSDVCDLGNARGSQLALQRHVELVQKWRSQIGLKAERGVRRRDREVARERIGQRHKAGGRGEIRRKIEIRRAEVQPFARREGRMVVVDAVSAAQHRGRRLVKGPGGADTRRPVVEIAFVSRTRHAVGPHRRQARRFAGRIRSRDRRRRPAARSGCTAGLPRP